MNANLPLLSVAEALAFVVAGAPFILGEENVDLEKACGRTLAQDLKARRTQPPFAVSAMDGYAVRAADLAGGLAALDVIGVSAAGRGFSGEVKAGQAVRIFTGAPMPAGSDTVLIQENATLNGDRVTALESERLGRHVRPSGLDFREGEILLESGRRLAPAELALAAAMNHAQVPVARKPKVALLATGDELVKPGAPIGPDQIVSSNNFAVAAYARAAGADTIDLGIAKDNFDALEAGLLAAQQARADVLVTLGGASVGDHDLVQSALTRKGMQLSFWRIAMRPGKPLMHGRLGDLQILGLPGNPVSAVVCSILFLRPLIRALCGDPHAADDPSEPAVLGIDLDENDSRQDYLRSALARPDGGDLVATPFARQDSSMLRILADGQGLVVRPPYAPAAKAGEPCRVVRL
jgi:molybdopterin molybdotransferase